MEAPEDYGGRPASYSAVKRYLRRLDPPEERATLRVEVAPGEKAQVDGLGGKPEKALFVS